MWKELVWPVLGEPRPDRQVLLCISSLTFRYHAKIANSSTDSVFSLFIIQSPPPVQPYNLKDHPSSSFFANSFGLLNFFGNLLRAIHLLLALVSVAVLSMSVNIN